MRNYINKWFTELLTYVYILEKKFSSSGFSKKLNLKSRLLEVEVFFFFLFLKAIKKKGAKWDFTVQMKLNSNTNVYVNVDNFISKVQLTPVVSMSDMHSHWSWSLTHLFSLEYLAVINIITINTRNTNVKPHMNQWWWCTQFTFFKHVDLSLFIFHVPYDHFCTLVILSTLQKHGLD